VRKEVITEVLEKTIADSSLDTSTVEFKDIELGELYPILGVITQIFTEDIHNPVIVVNNNVRLAVSGHTAKELENLRYNKIPSIFFSKLQAKEKDEDSTSPKYQGTCLKMVEVDK